MDVMKSSIDKIIALYQRDIDVTLIRENLKLTPTERLDKLWQWIQVVEECHRAGRKLENQEAKK
jgi:hypothetical protein